MIKRKLKPLPSRARSVEAGDIAQKLESKKKTVRKVRPEKEELETPSHPFILPEFLPKERVSEMPLDQYANYALLQYGSHVVEDRAIPDYRDGLKPSHRAVLWSMFELGLWPSLKLGKKAARVVGDAMGKYHPHGDAGTYGAMVTLACTVPPLVDGSGNWSTPVDREAAMRYTEAKLSKFAMSFLMDKDYLEVAQMALNYSGDAKIPLVMPALLPMLLVLGNTQIPAYGVACGNPIFTLRSVSKLVIALLKGKKATVDLLMDTLEVRNDLGCEVIHDAQKSELRSLLTTGRGGLTYCPLMEVDYKAKEIYIRSYGPRFSSEDGVAKMILKLSDVEDVSKVRDDSGVKNLKSGYWSACFTVVPVRGISEDRLHELFLKVKKILTARESYDLGVTIRKTDRTGFTKLNYVKFINVWIKARIRLEEAHIANQVSWRKAKLHVKEGIAIVSGTDVNLDKAIKIIRSAEDPRAKLMSVFKITEIQADAILDLKLRALSKMDNAALKKEIAALKAEISDWEQRGEKPGLNAAADLVARIKEYEKKPDLPRNRMDAMG